MSAVYPATPNSTPYFSGVKSDDFQGPADALTITVNGKNLTLSEAIAAGGQSDTGVQSIEASQGDVTSGQASVVTLTAILKNGTTSQTVFDAPPGAPGKSIQGGPGIGISDIAVTQGGVTAGKSSPVTLTVTLTDGTTSALQFMAPPGARGASGDSAGETSELEVTTAGISEAYALTATDSTAYDLTVTSPTALTLSGGLGGTMQVVTVQLRQTGDYPVTLPKNVKWAGGTVPDVTQIAGQIALFSFMTMDAGTTWVGKVGF